MTTNYVGTAVLKPGFYAYQLTPGHYEEGVKMVDTRDPVLLFAGEKYELARQAAGSSNSTSPQTFCRTALFAPVRRNPSPSVDPNKPLPEISFSRISREGRRCGGREPCGLVKTSFYIRPPTIPAMEGEDPALGLAQQDSFINVALGGVDPETGGFIGARRGGSQLDVLVTRQLRRQLHSTKREALAFTGDLATVASPSGSHFLGTENPNFVIGLIRPEATMSDATSRSIQAAARRGAVRLDLSCRHREERLATAHADPVRTVFRYATGMVQSEVPATSFQNVVTSTSPDDLTVTLDPVANSLSGSITVRDVTGLDGATEAYVLGFRRQLTRLAEPLGLFRRQALRRNRKCHRDFGDRGLRRKRRPAALQQR